MRPKYVSQEDVKREARRAAKFVAFLSRTAPQHQWAFLMSAPFANYDFFVLKDGQRVAVVECRDRFGDGSQHQCWHTSKAKIQRSLDAAASLKLPLILLYAWDEDTYFTKGENLVGLPTHQSGRADRNDPMDWEEMLLMPPSIFKRY